MTTYTLQDALDDLDGVVFIGNSWREGSAAKEEVRTILNNLHCAHATLEAQLLEACKAAVHRRLGVLALAGVEMTEPQLNIPLKACPFCGGKAAEVLPTGSGHAERWYVLCPDCDACGPTDLGESGACEAWNTRPLEARLLEACKELHNWLHLHIKYDQLIPSYYDVIEKSLAAIAAAEGAP